MSAVAIRGRSLAIASVLLAAGCASGPDPAGALEDGPGLECAQTYDSSTLAERHFAFIGEVREVVSSLEPADAEPGSVQYPSVSFAVVEPLRAIAGAEVTVDVGWGDVYQVEVGDRLLIAGNSGRT